MHEHDSAETAIQQSVSQLKLSAMASYEALSAIINRVLAEKLPSDMMGISLLKALWNEMFNV